MTKVNDLISVSFPLLNIPEDVGFAGVYKLTCLINNKVYVGKANDIKVRLKSYVYKVNSKAKHTFIESVIRKHGIENFSVDILHVFESVCLDELFALETAFIEFYNSTNPDVGYNRCLFHSDASGVKRSQNFRLKMRRARLGSITSQETKDKLRLINLGRKVSEATKLKMSLALKGKIPYEPNDQSRKRQSENHADFRGAKHPSFDASIHYFQRKEGGELFIGTQFDFRKKFELNGAHVCSLTKGKRKSHKGWVCIK